MITTLSQGLSAVTWKVFRKLIVSCFLSALQKTWIFLGLFYHKEVILFFKFTTAVKWPVKKTTSEPINVDLS